MQVRADDARLVRRRQHDRAGAVAEQHAGAAVGPVDEARQAFDADHERALRLAEADVLVGDRERVDETAAGGLERERRAAVDVEALLQQRAGVREDQVGRGRADDDEVDVGRRHAGGLQRASCRVLGQRGTRFVRGRDVAPLDAGARADPLVGGVDRLLEILVREDLFRQVAAGAGDARIAVHGGGRRPRDGARPHS